MMESLFSHQKDAVIYAFAFDDLAYQTLKSLALTNVTPVSLSEFEDTELLRIKPSRSRGEYCWTCTPSILLYCIQKLGVSECTYLDADLYFFSSPQILIDEMKDQSVLITPHWYTPRYDQTALSGYYCVQFVTIRNTESGLKVLNWWRNRCIDWCYARAENGKFGDQKYLDDWTTRFEGIHVLENRGGGMAPWNIQQYQSQNGIEWVQIQDRKKFNAVFFHFHALEMITSHSAFLGNYHLSNEVIRCIYEPYLERISSKNVFLKEKFNIEALLTNPELKTFKSHIKRAIKGIARNLHSWG